MKHNLRFVFSVSFTLFFNVSSACLRLLVVTCLFSSACCHLLVFSVCIFPSGSNVAFTQIMRRFLLMVIIRPFWCPQRQWSYSMLSPRLSLCERFAAPYWYWMAVTAVLRCVNLLVIRFVIPEMLENKMPLRERLSASKLGCYTTLIVVDWNIRMQMSNCIQNSVRFVTLSVVLMKWHQNISFIDRWYHVVVFCRVSTPAWAWIASNGKDISYWAAIH